MQTTYGDAQSASTFRFAGEQPEAAGAEGPDERGVPVFSFAADGARLAGLRTELERRYEGPVCVLQTRLSAQRAEDLQHDVDELAGPDGLEASVSVATGQVTLVVPVVDPQLQRRLDDRFGPGTVVQHAAFKAV